MLSNLTRFCGITCPLNPPGRASLDNTCSGTSHAPFPAGRPLRARRAFRIAPEQLLQRVGAEPGLTVNYSGQHFLAEIRFANDMSTPLMYTFDFGPVSGLNLNQEALVIGIVCSGQQYDAHIYRDEAQYPSRLTNLEPIPHPVGSAFSAIARTSTPWPLGWTT